MKLDLHGKHTHDGYTKFRTFITARYYAGDKTAKVITGKGQMLEEFLLWCEPNPYIREATLNKDGGSFTIKLRKK